MALALYDPARFDRSPASIFSISNATADADVRLSTIRIENQVSVLDLRGAMRRKAERHRACFAAVLDRCYSRIRRCASVLRDECTFEIPLFLPGYPVYDVERCVRFVASHLAKNGFRVELMPGEGGQEGDREGEGEGERRMLVISWSTHDPNDDPPPPPLAYRPAPRVQNTDPMRPSWDPRKPVLQQRDHREHREHREEHPPPIHSKASHRSVDRQEIQRPPPPPRPSFGSAFAPLIPPERLLQPVSEFSPPQLGSMGTLPLAVGTRFSVPPKQRISSSSYPSTTTTSAAQVEREREEEIAREAPSRGRRPTHTDTHTHTDHPAESKGSRRAARSISEFRPHSKFALN